MDRNDLIENHSSVIAEAMQNHFGVPVFVSKSKTPYGVSHYVKPQFDLPQSEVPFTVRVSDHAAWAPRHHQIEHHVYPKENDHPKKFIDESIGAAKEYGKKVGLFPKDEFVPLTGDVYHPTFGTGKIIDSKPDVAKVDFGSKGVKNISSRFLQPVDPHNPDITKGDGGPITAYHGSPHDFDEFDTSKIGTGEGAQAYGHGLYFAESEPIAKGYRDALSDNVYGIRGADDNFYPWKDFANEVATEHNLKPGDDFGRKGWHEAFQTYAEQGGLDNLNESHIKDPFERKGYVKAKNYLQDADGIISPKAPGHMYEVAIDAHPDHMLDWDKPLSEQSPHIVKSIFDARKDNPTLFNVFKPHLEKDSTGMGFYQSLATHHPNGYQGASEFLQRAGIHGIKYLDANSRSATDQPTRNYVVFDHNRVSVKRKYEQGGYVRNAYKKGGKVEGSIWHEKHAFADGGDPRGEGEARGFGNATGPAERETEAPDNNQMGPEGISKPESEAEKLSNAGQIPDWAGHYNDYDAQRAMQESNLAPVMRENARINAAANAAEANQSADDAAQKAMATAFGPAGMTTRFGQEPLQAGSFKPEHFESTLEQNLVEPAFTPAPTDMRLSQFDPRSNNGFSTPGANPTKQHFESSLEQNLVEPAFDQPMPTEEPSNPFATIGSRYNTAAQTGIRAMQGAPNQNAGWSTPGSADAVGAIHLGGTPNTEAIQFTSPNADVSQATPGPINVTQPAFPHTPTPAGTNVAPQQSIAPQQTNIPMPPTRPAELGPSATSSNIFDQINAANLQQAKKLEAQPNVSNPGYFNSTSGLSKEQWAKQMGADPNMVQTRLVDMGNGMQPDYYTKGLDQAFGDMANGIMGAPKAIASGVGNMFSPSQHYDPLTGQSRPDISSSVGSQFTVNPDTSGGRTRKVMKLMPDGTYKEVEEPYAAGGKVNKTRKVAKNPRSLHNSKIVKHALGKIHAPLSALNHPPRQR
jgi:hypothetical protein